MRGMTQREYEARLAWYELELNNPSRADWYAMQIAAEVRKQRYEKPSEVLLSDLQLEHKPLTKKTKPIESLKASKARWFGWLKVKKD